MPEQSKSTLFTISACHIATHDKFRNGEEIRNVEEKSAKWGTKVMAPANWPCTRYLSKLSGAVLEAFRYYVAVPRHKQMCKMPCPG